MRTIVRAKVRSARVDDRLLKTVFPSEATSLLRPLFHSEDFVFVLRKMGKSKWGTFQYTQGDPLTKIILDNQLLPESMLVTMLHEFAHYLVWKNCKQSTKPHGAEWKSAFRTVAIPFLTPDIFSPEVLRNFAHYLKNPGATATAHPGLYRALTRQEINPGEVALATLAEGTLFSIKGKRFIKGPKRRTRYACKCPDDGKIYTVDQALWVETEKSPDYA